MRSLSFYELTKELVVKTEYDPQLHVYTLKLTTDGNEMILIFTPEQLSQLADSMLKSVMYPPVKKDESSSAPNNVLKDIATGGVGVGGEKK